VEVAVNELDDALAAQVDALAAALKRRGWMLATAESCTGGLIAAACTSLSGSSDWFERGIVSYSNDAKSELLDVPAELIAAHGAVSAEVACAMADGALTRSRAQVAIAVTGIAGPSGGTPAKPVGTVWMAIGLRGLPAVATLLQLQGDRAAVRRQTVERGLQALNAALVAERS
jgi:nicotinamide-nucleotide amidase